MNQPKADYESAKRTVATIQRELNEQVAEIRGNRSLTDGGKKREIAVATLKAKKAAAEAKAAFVAERQSRREGMQRIAFGNTDTGTSSADQIAARDAADRAAKLKGEDDAKAALEQAILHNDTGLAKAVAAQAHQRGWNGIVDRYGSMFDRQVYIDRMDEIPVGPKTELADNLVFRVKPPRELAAHRSDFDLQRLVDGQAR